MSIKEVPDFHSASNTHKRKEESGRRKIKHQDKTHQNEDFHRFKHCRR